jgi:hypothetical protein
MIYTICRTSDWQGDEEGRIVIDEDTIEIYDDFRE